MQTPATTLRTRYELDFRVVSEMSSPLIRAEAYANGNDLVNQANRIGDAARAAHATHYRVLFAVPTLIGPGALVPETEIGFRLDVRNYPYAEPATWLISSHVPFSPHFKRGAPVCLGEIWKEHDGRMLLGGLLVHVARLLNWDEVARGGGYVGWNPEAVEYHRTRYGSRPLNPDLRYPSLPAWLHDLNPPALETPSFGRAPRKAAAPDVAATSRPLFGRWAS